MTASGKRVIPLSQYLQRGENRFSPYDKYKSDSVRSNNASSLNQEEEETLPSENSYSKSKNSFFNIANPAT